MESILLWTGIVLIVAAWIAIAIQAFKRLEVKEELEKFRVKRGEMQLRRNYCWVAMGVGAILILIAMLI